MRDEPNQETQDPMNETPVDHLSEDEHRLAQALLSSKPNGTTTELLASEEYSEYQFGSHPEVVFDEVPETDEDAMAEKLHSRDSVVDMEEVRKPFIPIGILNHSVGEDGKWARAVILDKDGIPKGIDEVSITADTSVQTFDPDKGDTMLESHQDKDGVTIRSIAHELNPLALAQVIEPSFFEVVNAFLRNDDEDDGQRYFIIEGHESKINGINMNEVFKRRRHLAELLGGLPASTCDQLTNWIDRSRKIDVMNLTWDDAKSLKGVDIDLSIDYVVTKAGTNISTTFAVLWRTIGGTSKAELLQIPVNPAELIAGTAHGSVNLQYRLQLDEHVDRVMVVDQTNDITDHIILYDIDVMCEDVTDTPEQEETNNGTTEKQQD